MIENIVKKLALAHFYNYKTPSTIMKKTNSRILSALFLFAGTSILLAQPKKTEASMEISGVTGVKLSASTSASPKQEEGGSVLDKSVKDLEDQILSALELFQKAGQPQEEQVKRFDDLLASLDKSLKSTAEGAALDQAIDAALAKQKQRVTKFQALANDPSLEPDQRDTYQSFVEKMKKDSGSIVAQRKSLRAIRTQLEDSKRSVEKNKEYYVNVMTEGYLEEASKALEQVTKSMQKVDQAIKDMGDLTKSMTGKKVQN